MRACACMQNIYMLLKLSHFKLHFIMCTKNDVLQCCLVKQLITSIETLLNKDTKMIKLYSTD